MMNRRMLWVLIPVLFATIPGCASKSNNLPLPSSAKTISATSIEIPFLYAESPNGETWMLEKNGPDITLNVINKGQIVNKIPLTDKISTFNTEKLGKQYVGGYRYRANEMIQLGNKVYQISEVDLNNSNESGKVVLNLSK
jgi:hypothetical protein